MGLGSEREKDRSRIKRLELGKVSLFVGSSLSGVCRFVKGQAGMYEE